MSPTQLMLHCVNVTSVLWPSYVVSAAKERAHPVRHLSLKNISLSLSYGS
jgi:hypothetical protein